jgi:hypothetical protein
MGECRIMQNEKFLAKYCQNNQVREDEMDWWCSVSRRGIHRGFQEIKLKERNH